MKKFYITTAIDYVNGEPHLGHTFEKLIADALARWHRILGEDVFFLTGTDEHGIKNQTSAEKLGMTPKEYVDMMSEKFKELWKLLNISYDFFIRTSDKNVHYPTAQEIWRKMVEKGDIYKKKYRGLYCKGCEAFLSEDELVDGKCPVHLTEPEVVEEENYFFKLSKYSDKVLELIKNDVIKIVPEGRKNEIISFIESGVEDISFSRDKKRVSWGIPVPDDENQVMYVWCDALTNYLSGIGYTYDREKFEKYWPADVHVIGKDILRFHALIWPAMLLSAGLEVPKTLLVHGMITSGGHKMSKSLGNIIDPREYVEKYGADALRYYVLREIPTLSDGDFTKENFIRKYNSDLADNLGNLIRRSYVFVKKYFDGKVPEGDKDEELWNKIKERIDSIEKEFSSFRINSAVAEIWKILDELNAYLNENEPWKREENRNVVIRNLLEGLRIVSILLNPVMPETSEKILKGFGLDSSHLKKENLDFGKLETGTEIKDFGIFFKKIEIEQDPFSFLDLKVAKIEKVEDVKESEKLYRLEISLGKEKRTLMAGLKKFYKPEELVGKKIVIIANLKPRKIFGTISQGMLLAGNDENENRPYILTVDAEEGSDVIVEGVEKNPKEVIKIEEFLSLGLEVRDGTAYYKDKPLKVGDKIVKTEKPVNGKIS